MAVTSRPESLNAPVRGMVYLSGGLALFTFQDAIMKELSGAYAVHELALIRCVFALPLIAWIVKLECGWRGFLPLYPKFVMGRAVLGFLSYTCWYLAIAAMPLADAATLYYSNPLFITALAAPLLGEVVGLRRWAAVLVGFAGVLVVMRPGLVTFEPAMLLALASSLFYAFSALITRGASGRVASSTFALWSTLLFAAGSAVSGLVMGDGAYDSPGGHPSLAFLVRAWSIPGWYDLGLIALTGPIAAISFYAISQGYVLAPASVVTPFEYSNLPWAVLLGYLLWGDLPDLWTWVGVALIAGSGIYIVQREAARGRRLVRGWPPMRPRL